MKKGKQAVAGLIGLAVLLVIVGIIFQVGLLGPNHHGISHKAIAAWGLAVVALVGASFARPEAG
ncbi:MAG: hypothetical protein ACYDGR_13035 [Candidatus Dormibacteria bacterium]